MSVSSKALLFPSQIKKEFLLDIEKEYEQMRSILPLRAHSILDIGCGVAGIDVLLYDHYRPDVNIFLLDKTDIQSRIYYGMKERGAFYNSLAISRRVLEENGVPKSNIFTQEATAHNDILFDGKFDIVLSLLSWGFHYPIATYLIQVYERLASGGMVIIDVRKDAEGVQEIERLFGSYTVLDDKGSALRIYARKK